MHLVSEKELLGNEIKKCYNIDKRLKINLINNLINKPMPTIITAPHCTQCQKEMDYWVTFFASDEENWVADQLIRLQLCNEPECANYWLLQLWIEGMRGINK